MKKLVAIFLCLQTPAWCTWTLIQSPVQTSASATCPVTVTALGAHHLVVYQAIYPTNADLTNVTATGETFTNGGVFHNTAGGGSVTMFYTLNSVGGATQVQSSNGSSASPVCRVWEYSLTTTPAILDDHQSQTASSSSGITPVIGGSNDVCIQSDDGVGAISGVSTYGNYNGLGASLGTADLENSVSTTPPTWTGGASGDSQNELCFKETVASTTGSKRKTIERIED